MLFLVVGCDDSNANVDDIIPDENVTELRQSIPYQIDADELFLKYEDSWVRVLTWDSKLMVNEVYLDDEIIHVELENGSVINTSLRFDVIQVDFLVNQGHYETIYGLKGLSPSIEAPELEGFTFEGWDHSTESIQTSKEIHALFEPITYNVTFNTETPNESISFSVTHGAVIEEVPQLEKLGYTFLGWFNNDQLWDSSDAIKASMNLVPRFEVTEGYIFDPHLQSALIESNISMDDNGAVDIQAAQTITSLDLSYFSIEDLSGIEVFKNLEYINLRGNNLTTLTPLLVLDRLEIVKSANNRLSDSPLYISDVDSGVEALREQGVAVHNAIFQQVSPTPKNASNTTYTWKTLLVIPKEIDTQKDGHTITSDMSEDDLNTLYLEAELFSHAINNLAPDDVWIEVEIYVTESIHQGDINVYDLDEGPSFWLYPRQINEIQSLSSEYDSILVLHDIDDNRGYAGLGGYDSDLGLGFASIRFDAFQFTEDQFFPSENMSYATRLEASHMDWGNLVMIHEFLHGLEFYGTDVLNLPIWNLHDSASHYEEQIEDDYSIYDFDKSLTRDILWYEGYLSGDLNPLNSTETTVTRVIFEKPPRLYDKD